MIKKNKKANKIVQKPIKKQDENTKNFKNKYFDFYDDIKDYTRGKEDW